MARLSYEKFYGADWTRDTRKLSRLARAAWIDLLVEIWDSDGGETTLSLPAVGGVIGADWREAARMVRELETTKVAEVVWRDRLLRGVSWVWVSGEIERIEKMDNDVLLHETVCNVHVTIISRRVKREASERKSTRERVAKHREKNFCETGNGNVTDTRARSISTSISIDGTTVVVPDAKNGDGEPGADGTPKIPLEEMEARIQAGFASIPEGWIEEIQKTYPDADVDLEIAKAERYAIEHAGRYAERRAGFSARRFVVGWLNRMRVSGSGDRVSGEEQSAGEGNGAAATPAGWKRAKGPGAALHSKAPGAGKVMKPP